VNRKCLPACACHGPKFMHRLFAWFMHSSDDLMHKAYGERKQQTFNTLSGKVAEIGPGAGANFRYYPKGLDVTGIEPNPFMHPYMRDAAAQHSVNLTIHECGGELLPLEENVFDTVVCTLVLCSVDDPHAVVRESKRILKPGGRFLFIEHVAAKAGSTRRTVQNLIRPAWNIIGDGCCPNRETWKILENAGFSLCHIEHFQGDVPIPFIKPHIAGYAVK
jgi:ubiquinone/menaquinone biosynthesis C-methylase UbiE